MATGLTNRNIIQIRIWNGDCQDLYLNFHHSLHMLNQSLADLDSKLVKALKSKPAASKDEPAELLTFYGLLTSLHENIREHLRHQFATPRSRPPRDQSESSLAKSANLAHGPTIANEEELLYASFSPLQSKSMNQQARTKAENKNWLKLAMPGQGDKNFQQLMENIKVIIQYQNKVEKYFLLFNNQQPMSGMCIDANLYSDRQSSRGDKENNNNQNGNGNGEEQMRKMFDFDSMKAQFRENIRKVMDQCRGIQEVQESFVRVDTGNGLSESSRSENQSTDKKSLLTEMLRESQILDSEYPSPSPKKRPKKPTSQTNYPLGSSKRLQKEIDLQGYKISGLYGKREKKGGIGNCGQCSQCSIF